MTTLFGSQESFSLRWEGFRYSIPAQSMHPADHRQKIGDYNMAQHIGQVKWFNNAKGYGFVGRDGGPDVFCHFSSIQAKGYKSLEEGDEVEFDIIEGEKGRPQTHEVKKLSAK